MKYLNNIKKKKQNFKLEKKKNSSCLKQILDNYKIET